MSVIDNHGTFSPLLSVRIIFSTSCTGIGETLLHHQPSRRWDSMPQSTSAKQLNRFLVKITIDGHECVTMTISSCFEARSRLFGVCVGYRRKKVRRYSSFVRTRTIYTHIRISQISIFTKKRIGRRVIDRRTPYRLKSDEKLFVPTVH